MTVDSVVEQVHRLLYDNLPVRNTRTPSGWTTFDCPMCNDTRKRAGVITNGAKISFNCFNCGFKTGWAMNPYLGKKYKDVALKLGCSSADVHNAQMELLKIGDELQEQEGSSYVYNLSKFEQVELPENVQTIESLPDGHELKEYARSRSILGIYPLLHFNDLANKRRVIVPFTYNGDVVGWTGRHVAPPDKQTPKYLHKLQPGYVFNVDAFANSEREIVIVTEGVFDAILIDGVSV
jgi:transcription elongation factor Elf1